MVLSDILLNQTIHALPLKVCLALSSFREGDPLSPNMSSRPCVAKAGINGNPQSVDFLNVWNFQSVEV